MEADDQLKETTKEEEKVHCNIYIYIFFFFYPGGGSDHRPDDARRRVPGLGRV